MKNDELQKAAAELSSDEYIVKVTWSEIEGMLKRKIPFEQKEHFIKTYGGKLNVLHILSMWKRICVSLGITGFAFDLGKYGLSGEGHITAIAIVTSVFFLIVSVVQMIYRNCVNKKIDSWKPESFERQTAVTEAWTDVITKPTLSAAQKLSNTVLPILRSMWDYFFGEVDEKISNVTVRRRRQLLLAGIIATIAFLMRFSKWLSRTKIAMDVARASVS